MSRKRILYVATVDWFFLSHRLPLAIAAKDAGYEVSIAASDTGVAHRIIDAGLNFVHVPFSRSSLNPLTELKSMVALWVTIRRLRPDILHNVSLKPVLYAGIAGRLAGVPNVISAITGFGHLFSATSGGRMRTAVQGVLRRLWDRRGSVIIVQNQDHADFLRETGLAGRSNLVVIQGAGVDLDRFQPSLESENSDVVVLPARMLVSKGVLEFAEAARALKAEGASHRFVLVGPAGDDNPESISAEELRQLEISHGIEWWGQRDDMEKVLAQAKLVVLPSYAEGMPKSLIEALACGRPIVTTDIPGCRQLVDNGNNGWLVEPRDVSGLTTTLSLALGDSETLKTMGSNARKFAVEHLSIEKVIADTLSIYAGRT